MKKFLVLYMAPWQEMQKMMEHTPREEAQKGMEEWKKWMASHKEIVDIGAPVGKNMRVKKEGAAMERNDIGGYSFVEAESLEAAAALMKDNPHFTLPGAYIEIMECMKM